MSDKLFVSETKFDDDKGILIITLDINEPIQLFNDVFKARVTVNNLDETLSQLRNNGTISVIYWYQSPKVFWLAPITRNVNDPENVIETISDAFCPSCNIKGYCD